MDIRGLTVNIFEDRLDLLYPGLIGGAIFVALSIAYLLMSCLGDVAVISKIYDPLKGDPDEFWFGESDLWQTQVQVDDSVPNDLKDEYAEDRPLVPKQVPAGYGSVLDVVDDQ